MIQQWDTGEVPTLSKFVPDGSLTLRRLILSELIKVDLEYRWNRGLPRRIEEYLADFPELAASGVPCDLIFEEYQVRRCAGEAVAAEEYQKRFPDRAQELGRLLGAPPSRRAGGRVGGPADVEAGQVLDDFDLLALVGEGAFARVFLARQKSLQRLVALKVSERLRGRNRRRSPSSIIRTSSASTTSVSCPIAGCDCSTCRTCRAERCARSWSTFARHR